MFLHISFTECLIIILSIDSKIFPDGSNAKFQAFLNMSDDQQRKAISEVRKRLTKSPIERYR